MALTAAQKETTSRELKANLELSGLSIEQIAADLDHTPEEIEHALAVDDECRPMHVWRLRDCLEERVEEQGKEPVPFTVLKENRFYPYRR